MCCRFVEAKIKYHLVFVFISVYKTNLASYGELNNFEKKRILFSKNSKTKAPKICANRPNRTLNVDRFFRFHACPKTNALAFCRR